MSDDAQAPVPPADQPQDAQAGGMPAGMPSIPLGPDGLPDFSQIDPSTLPQMPQVDQELAERVVLLYQEVDTMLNEMNVGEDERKEIEQNLMEAIAADLLVRLGEHLSRDEKEELTAMAEESNGQPDLNQVAAFFRDKFEQEELVHNLAAATESVLKEFSASMGNKDK